MKDKKRIEVLLKVIKRIYDQNPEMQELTDVSMVELCPEEFAFLFAFLCCCLYQNELSKQRG